jgi:hypothetical protein
MKLKEIRNNHKVRLIVIIVLIIIVAILYFKDVNLSNMTSLEGVKQELGENYKPDTVSKKVLAGAAGVLAVAGGLEASQTDWDLSTGQRVLRDKMGNVVDPSSAGAKDAKYTDEYNCDDFKYQEEAQSFFEKAGGISNDTNRLDGNKDGVACQALQHKK